MRLVSWNVNSLRSRIDLVADRIDSLDADVVALQETKCNNLQFAELEPAFTRLGYEVVHHGVNHWNGVAIASRVGLSSIRSGFARSNRPPYDEPRLISARCGPTSAPVTVATVYVPNGRTLEDPHYLYKLVWLERLRAEALVGGWVESASIICGDFNVAPADGDIYDPRRFRGKTHASAPEREAVAALIDLGFVDAARAIHPDSPEFTWWNYRQTVALEPGGIEHGTDRPGDRGLRIDLALVSNPLWPRVQDCWVDRQARATDRPSDHAPLVVDLAE